MKFVKLVDYKNRNVSVNPVLVTHLRERNSELVYVFFNNSNEGSQNRILVKGSLDQITHILEEM